MPGLRIAGRLESGALRAVLVRCDGRDARRVEPERVDCDRVWIVVAGCFSWRDRARRAVADPATALMLRGGEPFEIRHPEEARGDVCLSVAGPLAARVVAEGDAGPRSLELAAFLRWSGLAARLRRGAPVAQLELEEALATSFTRSPRRAGPPPTRRERDVAAAIAHELQLGVGRGAPPESLASLAAAAGVSPFHACRVFRAVTGRSIHQQRMRVRARHAVARLLGGDEPLSWIAAECGYASQSHMTRQLVRFVGVTPGRLRTAAGRRLLREREPW